MVLGLTVFVSVLSVDLHTYSEQLREVESHAQLSLERYLSLAIKINEGFIDTIAGDWNSYVMTTDSVNFKEFSDRFVTTLLPSAYFSVILTCCGERYYNHDEYSSLRINLDCISADRSVHVLFGDFSTPFGDGERLYIAGEILEHDGQEYRIYVGFLETLMVGNFIGSVDKSHLAIIRGGLDRTVRLVTLLLLFVIVGGFVLLYHALKLKVVVYSDIVREMGGKPGGKRKTDPCAKEC